ncbi:MAG: hypothetical protein L6Q47_00525 [Ignavibacteriaceae bacterium]|nr:hypothetical protein [Ignavibacteriaceae bacterium]
MNIFGSFGIHYLSWAAALLLSALQFSYGQFYNGVRQTALSFSSVSAYQDVFSAVQNPALFSPGEQIEIKSFYSPSPFGLNELALLGAGASFSLRGTRVTTSIASYGYSLYRENTLMISAAANMFGFNAGLSLQAAHVNIKGYGTSLVPVFSAGIRYPLFPFLSVGSSFSNLANASWSNTNDQIGQTSLFGIRYEEEDFLALSFTLKNESGYKAEQLAGLEVKPSEYLLLMAGMQFTTRQYSAGISFIYMGIVADYSTVIHPILGLSHQFALGYTIR